MRTIERLTKELDKKHLEREQLSNEIARLWRASGDLDWRRLDSGEILDYWTCFTQEYQPLLNELKELETGVARRVAALRAPQPQPQPQPEPVKPVVAVLPPVVVERPKSEGPPRGTIPPIDDEIEALVRTVALANHQRSDAAVDRYHRFHLRALDEKRQRDALAPEFHRQLKEVQRLRQLVKNSNAAAAVELSKMAGPFATLEREHHIHQSRYGRFCFELRRLRGEAPNTYRREK